MLLRQFERPVEAFALDIAVEPSAVEDTTCLGYGSIERRFIEHADLELRDRIGDVVEKLEADRIVLTFLHVEECRSGGQ